MKPKWSVKVYEKKDINKIFELDTTVHPKEKCSIEKWMRWWNWKYVNNPAGFPKIWLAEINGKIIGYYAIIHIMIKCGDKIIVGSQSVDTMTHPHYRHQRIFETLARRTYDQAKKDGIKLVYGFPNEYSYPGFVKKLGWFNVCSMPSVIKPYNIKNLFKHRIKNKFLQKICILTGNTFINIFYRICKPKKPPEVAGLTIYEIAFFDDSIDDFWKKISKEHNILVVRNKIYLNWKYVSVPDVNYIKYLAEKDGEVCGYVVLRCVKKQDLLIGFIYDIMASLHQPLTILSLISKAIEYFENKKVDAIFYIGTNHTINRIFKNAGFIMIPPFLFKRYFIIHNISSEIPTTYLKDKRNWFVQMMGDSDAI